MEHAQAFRVGAPLAALLCLVGSAFAQPSSKTGAAFRLDQVSPRDRVAASVDDNRTIELPGQVSPMARRGYDRGAVSPEYPAERVLLMLQPDAEQQQALETLLEEQQNPQSAYYRQWLTPEEFGRRFGASSSDINRVTRWLESHGFQVEPPAASGRLIVFSGTAAQLQSAFHTAMHTYEVNGEVRHANATAPQIPQAFAGVVGGIVSLHDFRAQPQHHALPAAQAAPLLTSEGNYNVAPGDFATIYDVDPLYTSQIDGAGQSIAIVGRTNVPVISPVLNSVSFFRATTGLPDWILPTVIVNGPDPGVSSSWQEVLEAMVDIEWSGATAPWAKILLVVSQSTATTDGINLSAAYAVNHNLAPVMSTSFGTCEAQLQPSENQFWNSLWQQAAAQGISAIVASGDSGAAGCDSDAAATATHGTGVNGICSSPFATCVGGTEFDDTANPSQYWAPASSDSLTSALSYIPETAWNESSSGGLWSTGGGASILYPKPAWQSGPGVPSGGQRDVPDVSLNAAALHDAYIMYYNGGSNSFEPIYNAVGGTSVAAPAFAGLVALAVQHAGTRLGNVNPVLYGLAQLQASGGAAVFHDIISGNNSVPGVNGFSATPGYDQAAGLGSVDGAQLVNHWNDGSKQGPTFQLTVAPYHGTIVVPAGGQAQTTTVTVTPNGGFNSPVTLSAGTLPSGITASFSPATLPSGSGSSTLTMSALEQVAAGQYYIAVTATGGGFSQTTALDLDVQLGCYYSFIPATLDVPNTGGIINTIVYTSAGCPWTASIDQPWATITAGRQGVGLSIVTYSIQPNFGASSRSFNLSAGSPSTSNQTLAVTQDGGAPPLVLTPSVANVASGSGTGTMAVWSSSGASWTATASASWITITSGASGAGSGTVTYSVAANPSYDPRSATITIGGITAMILQAGLPCNFSVSPTTINATAAGGVITLQVTGVTAACSWTSTPLDSSLTLTPTTGSGPGSASLTVAANANPASRINQFYLANQLITVNQAAPTFALSPAFANVAATAGAGTVAVSAIPATAAWTAVSNSSWITLTSSSGTGNQTVSYTVAANSSPNLRDGAITIAGLAFPIVQAGSACGITVAPASLNATAGGGNLSVNVTTPANCDWTATSNSAWLTIASGASGSGTGTVSLTAALNTTPSSRMAALSIVGQSVSVTQAPATFSLSPTAASASAAAGTGTVAVTATPGVTWTAVSNSSWITITSGASAASSQSVSYSVAANTTTVARSGMITIAGIPFTIAQAGMACGFAVTPTSVNAAVGGSAYSATVTAPSGCAWTATSGTSWLTISSGASGSGNGTVSYSAAANTAASRSGSLTIAGQSVSVSQAGPAFTLSPASANVGAAASTGTVAVTATPASATWTATSNASWITVTSGAPGTGNRSVGYSVAANTTTSARSGAITIAGISFSITQAGITCTFTVTPASVNAVADGGTYSAAVTAPAACARTATTSTSWLTISAGASGSGSGSVFFAAAANTTTASRSGSVTIAGRTVTVTQAAPAFVLSQTSASVAAAGATGSVAVTTTSSAVAWTATSSAAWITITSGASSTGNKSVAYSVAANTSTAARSGTITIAGIKFTINQAGLTCSFSVTSMSLAAPAGGGSLAVTVAATSPGCSWTASTSTAWLKVTAGVSGSGNGSVSFSVAASTATASRSGSLTVAGKTVTVTQAHK